MRRFLVPSFLLLLSGCGLPPAVAVASYAADGISYVFSSKSVSDHGISLVAQRDCAVWRIVVGRPICAEPGQPSPTETAPDADAVQLASLGEADDTNVPGLPPAALPSAARMPDPPAGGYLMVGSFIKADNARRAAARLAPLPVSIETATIGGRRLHRVITGPLTVDQTADLRRKTADAVSVRPRRSS